MSVPSVVKHGTTTNNTSGMRLLYLPPYSPDFNPIKEAFSCIKAWIRFHRDEVLVEMDGGCHENAAWFSLNFSFFQVSLHSLTYREVIANSLHSLPQFPSRESPQA